MEIAGDCQKVAVQILASTIRIIRALAHDDNYFFEAMSLCHEESSEISLFDRPATVSLRVQKMQESLFIFLTQ